MNVRFTRRLCLSLCIASLSTLAPTNYALAQSTVFKHNYPGLTITGTVGANYPIQYVDAVSNSWNWVLLTNLVLQQALTS